MHLPSRALEEASAPADEQRVAREDGAAAVAAVLEQEADAVLGVAGRVQGADRDARAGGQRERRVVRGRRRDARAVAPADDRERVVFELFSWALVGEGGKGRGVGFVTISTLPPAWSPWWCVLMMLLRLIAPLSVCFFSTGRTLCVCARAWLGMARGTQRVSIRRRE